MLQFDLITHHGEEPEDLDYIHGKVISHFSMMM